MKMSAHIVLWVSRNFKTINGFRDNREIQRKTKKFRGILL